LLIFHSPTDEDPFSKRCSVAGDFESLAETISERLIAKHGSHPLYAKFVEQLVRGVCGPLKDNETRKAASGLTTLANEKQKAAKEATSKKKKPGKPALGATKSLGAGRADVGAYDEILDDSGDYDDFVRLAFCSVER
jgi:translation initiation factor 3 subunit J